MEIEGKLLQIMPIQNISGQKGPLKKLEFIIEVESKFPKKVCFSLWNEKVDQFTAKTGELIKIHFDLESRLYNNKWYTEAKAWKVENTQSAASNVVNEQAEDNDLNLSTFSQKDELDDLPF